MNNFKIWLENEESKEILHMEIPMPQDIIILNEIFKKYHKKLYAVGGVVRDYLISHFHLQGKGDGPKDVDLTTDATPEDITKILQSKESLEHGIKVLPKGEAFGVISAILNGNEYEIATFREEYYDPIHGDGRRPDKVSFSTAEKDASRRDLTINALFYDIDKKQIIDFNTNNGKGQGIEDIKNLVSRTVGDPHERFQEDKLRILRIVRFFSRFNPGLIKETLDKKTLDAIERFKSLPGVSTERILAEFSNGFKSAINKTNFFKNYEELNLFTSVLPTLITNTQNFENVKSFPASLAFLLRDNTEPTTVRKKLTNLSYPNNISDKVELLLKLTNIQNENIITLIKKRDIIPNIKEDIIEFAKLQKNNLIHKFANYNQQTKSFEFIHLKGPEIAKAMNEKEKELFLNMSKY